MSGRMVIGAAQRTPLAYEKPLEAFQEDVAKTVRDQPEIDLLVYPELHLNGNEHLPVEEREEAYEKAAVPLDSPFVEELGKIAAGRGIWLCPGSISERGPEGELFNTQLLFDPAGRLRASYRKIFPWRPFETHQPGTEFVVQDLDGRGVAGMSICYDAWFPEHSRQLAWLGADVVLNVVKTTSPDRSQELVLARANAITNQNVVVSVNTAGPIGRGRSIIVSPEGFVMAEAGIGEETLIVRFDAADVQEVRDRGTMYTNRLWAQFREGDKQVPLPMYEGRIDPATWAPQKQPGA